MATRRGKVEARINLDAHAFCRRHDETRVPMTFEVKPVGAEFEGPAAAFRYLVTYTCPQCGIVVELEAEVSSKLQAGVEGMAVAWFHGPGPS